MIDHVAPPFPGSHHVALNAAFAGAPDGETIRLHGEWNVGPSVIVKNKRLAIDGDDAHLIQLPRFKSQFGEPMFRITGNSTVLADRLWLTGSNHDGRDGVKAGAEGWHGITVGGGVRDVELRDCRVENTWSDLVFVGSFGGKARTGRIHNRDVAIIGLHGHKAGRHAFTVRDCIGYRVAHTAVTAIRRLWFDHEPKSFEHFTDALFEHNEGPQGGQNLWAQILSRPLSECGNITFRDHVLTRGNFRVAAKGGLIRTRHGLTLQRLHRAPENPAELGKKLAKIRGWKQVVVDDVDGIDNRAA